MDKSILHQRALWRSRRGLLELDLLFRPFVEECFEQLTPEMQNALDDLLNLDDMELLEFTQNPHQTPDYAELVQAVLQFRKTGNFSATKPNLLSIKPHPVDPSGGE